MSVCGGAWPSGGGNDLEDGADQGRRVSVGTTLLDCDASTPTILIFVTYPVILLTDSEPVPVESSE